MKRKIKKFELARNLIRAKNRLFHNARKLIRVKKKRIPRARKLIRAKISTNKVSKIVIVQHIKFGPSPPINEKTNGAIFLHSEYDCYMFFPFLFSVSLKSLQLPSDSVSQH